MNMLDLLSELRRTGILLSLDGDKLKIKAPPGTLTNDIKEQLKQHKEGLIEFLRETSREASAEAAIPRRANPAVARLSYGQQRLWNFEELNPGTAANNMPSAVRIRGSLDLDILEQALLEIIRRHEALRTSFVVNEEGEPQQIIHAQVDWKLQRTDLAGLGQAEQDVALQRRINANRLQPVALNQPPLLRAEIITTGQQDEYYLLFCMHHIISDGSSVALFFRELVTLYLAFSRHLPSPLPALGLHYADFSEWQRERLTSDRFEAQLHYWQRKLAGAPALLDLPLDHPRPPVQSTAGATINVDFDKAFIDRMRGFCSDQGLTPFMFTLAAWKILLSRYSGHGDILVGVPTLGRDSRETEAMIGFFIHSLVLRTSLSDNPSASELLQRIKHSVLDAFAHGDVPVDMIVERLGLRRNPAYTPLVQVAFQLFDRAGMTSLNDLPLGQFGNLSLEPVGESGGTAKFDLTLSLFLSGNQLRGSLEYSTALFEQRTVERLLDHYQHLCSTLLDALDQPVHSLALETPAAQQDALELDAEQYESVIPLSAMQFDMFMDNQVNPDSLQSSHGWHIPIHRALNVELWQHCLQHISDHQPMLRVRFVSGTKPWHDMGYLAVRRQHLIPFEVLDLRGQPQTPAQLDALIRQRIYRPYDLHQDELIRYGVIRLADDHQIVYTAVHHAILDGAALNSLWEQITALYSLLDGQGDPASFNHLPANYPDFVAHDRRVMDTAAVLAFWREQCRNVEPLDFTVPAPIPAPAHFITQERWLDEQHQSRLKRYCREQRITPALYLKTLYALMIQVYCRPDADFAIQETMGGRIKGHQHSLGCYIQEIPFIVSKDALAPANSLSDLLDYARQYQKTIKDQRLISIGKQLEIAPRGRVGFMFNYYQFLAHTDFLGEILDPEGTPSDPAHNVQFVVTEVGGKLKFNLFYHGHLFADLGLLERIEALSLQILDGHIQQLKDLQLVTAAERDLLLHQWNNTAADFDLSQCIHQRFEQQAEQHPERIAVADDHISYRYDELNRRANQLAHYLRSQGIDRNHLVGLCAERSAHFLMGILAIMKAGAAYVPMDARYPQDRIDYMIQNSDVAVLLTEEALLEKVGHEGRAQRLCLDRDWPQIAQQPDHNPNIDMSPQDRAYMLYTSGSTGLPKGALIRHDGAINHIEAERKALHFDGSFNFLQSAPASSDISVWQFVGAVTCGGKTVILDDVTHAKKLFDLVNQHQIHLVELVPVALQLLMEHVRSLPEDQRAMPSLKWMMATGEAVSVDLVNDWLSLYPDIPVVNAYGPTEAADDVIQASIHEPLGAERSSVPIGTPLANLAVFILDDQRRLVPPGIPGEICIGGVGVGEGYWRNEEKTADAFIPNPFEVSSPTLYRTGDLGRWLADGTVEYLNRIDNQVKVRGFRIELGEVEAALTAQEGVKEAAVIVRHDLPGGATLVGYVTPDEGIPLTTSDLRTALRSRLPDFMVPTSLNVLEKMPLTPAGKIDRKGLPRPESVQLDGKDYVAPRTELETQLAQIWEAFLPADRVGVRDDFFELGGHSLIGVRLVARINKELGTQLQVAALLMAQTIEKLASLIEQGESTSRVLVPLATSGKRPLFLIHPVGGDVLLYRELAQALATDFDIYGLRARGLDGQPPASTLSDMVSSYLAEIRKVQPVGPYRLGGQSLGGIFALALAQALEQAGETVEPVVLLDTFSPTHLRQTYRTDTDILSAALGHNLPATKDGEGAGKTSNPVQDLYRMASRAGVIASDLPETVFQSLYQVATSNHQLASQMEVESIQAKVHHFTAKDNPQPKASGDTWQDAPLHMDFHQVAGGHETLMQGPNAATLARQIIEICQ